MHNLQLASFVKGGGLDLCTRKQIAATYVASYYNAHLFAIGSRIVLEILQCMELSASIMARSAPPQAGLLVCMLECNNRVHYYTYSCRKKEHCSSYF